MFRIVARDSRRARTMPPRSPRSSVTPELSIATSVPAAAWADPVAVASVDAIDRDTAVLEMAYGGTGPSALGRAVRGRVARYADGLGMLVHQAARAIELALGESPPLASLFTAARTARL